MVDFQRVIVCIKVGVCLWWKFYFEVFWSKNRKLSKIEGTLATTKTIPTSRISKKLNFNFEFLKIFLIPKIEKLPKRLFLLFSTIAVKIPQSCPCTNSRYSCYYSCWYWTRQKGTKKLQQQQHKKNGQKCKFLLTILHFLFEQVRFTFYYIALLRRVDENLTKYNFEFNNNNDDGCVIRSQHFKRGDKRVEIVVKDCLYVIVFWLMDLVQFK